MFKTLRGIEKSADTEEMPDDIHEKSSRHISVVAGLLATFSLFNSLVRHGEAYFSDEIYPSKIQAWELLGVAFLVLASVAAVGAMRRLAWSSEFRRNIGIVYLTLIAYPISLTDHADHYWQGGHRLYGLPYVVLLMLVFPVIVPLRGRSALLVALIMAAMGPLALETLHALLGYDKPSFYTLVGAFPWLVAILSAVLARTVHQLGMQLKEAEQLGSYTLIERIGIGSMGAVFRARHAMLRRPTAVKLLPLEMAGKKSIARFEKEVQLTAMLTHPNTITVFDYGRTPRGTFYYAMELLSGANLNDIVAVDGPQPTARVVHILSQAAGALAEAHAIRLIHRDIKPSNIMLTERGGKQDVTKVLDFGLVRDLEQSEGVRTDTGAITGTPLYLAPEAIKTPDMVGPGVDIYALGAVGYFLLSGHHVFEGASVLEVCASHLYDTPIALSKRVKSPIPPQLEAIIMQCLAKEESDRPSSIFEMEQRLLACLDCGHWTDKDAKDWWLEHSTALQAVRDHRTTDASQRTLFVDHRAIVQRS